MQSKIFLLFLLNLVLRLRIAYGETKDEYLKKRNQFIQEEKTNLIGGNIKLTEAESKVNQFLMHKKIAEINAAKNNDTIFPPETHFFQAKPFIDKSPVFQLIQKIPKGGALHIHDSALVDIHWLIRRATYDPNCYMCTDDHAQLHFKFFPKPPGNYSGCVWQQVMSVRKQFASATEFDQKLYRAMTMTVDDPDQAYKTQDIAWIRFLSLFGTAGGLFTYAPVFTDYCTEALTQFYADNVQYMEIRALLLKAYELDGTVHDGDWAMDVYSSCFRSFQKKHPDFSGAKIIFTSVRSLDKTDILGDVKTAIRYVKKYGSMFAGYDLVSQEDKGHSLYYFLDALLAPAQNGTPVRYFFHAGETDWQGLSVDENLIDAILLNTTRIGHAFAITKHPDVMAKVMKKGIALEINPISNQVLKLVGDLRDHPAASLLAQDYPLVVSSDDPALWGATPLSHDFYEVFMGLGGSWADLKTLKKLAINSLGYSAMSKPEKTLALKVWQKKWQHFIDNTIKAHNL